MKKKIFSTLLLVAFALASTSMFVSCKDYDDDFAKRDADIAALRAELEQRLAQCKANCDAEHAKFLTEHQSLAGYAKLSDIPSLDGYAKLTDIPSLDGYATVEALSALQAELANYVKAEAIQDALDYIKSLQEKGLTADGLAELMTKVKAIDEALGDYAKIDYVDNKVETAANNLQLQIDALDLYKKALEDEGIDPDLLVDLLKKIRDMKEFVQTSYPADKLTAEEVASLKALLEEGSGAVDPVAPDLNMIQYLIDKTLASIVLMPSTYFAGLATIEVPALYYQPVIYCRDNNSVNEAYYYIDKNGKRLGDPEMPWGASVEEWRFCGVNAPSATIPTWDGGFGWSDDYSGYDYKGEGYNAPDPKTGKKDPDGDGTMLAVYRNIIEKYANLKTAKLIPNAIAKYHVNPTTVKLDQYQLSFFTNTATVVDQIESRNTGYLNSMATEFASPVEVDGAKYSVKEGLLEVPFKLRDWENYVEDLVYYFDGVALNKGKQSQAGIVRDSVNFIALQMTKGDTATITSDYAAVVPALLHIQAIADNGPENAVLKCNYDKFGGSWYTKKNENAGHMYTRAYDAINNAFTHAVAYNDTLDILPFVETHFTYIGVNSVWTSYDQRMDAETFKKLGLKYVFSIVDYEDGKHKTGESRHISIEPKANENADFGYDNVNLIPRSVEYSADGKSFSEIKDKVATREAIDREPLIKVEIVDPNNNVIEVGYIKLLITDNYKQYAFNLNIFDNYWMNCTAEGGLKWSQIEESILSVLGGNGYTKNQFEAEYKIDVLDGSSNAKRFKKDDNGKFVEDTDPIGYVYYTKPTPQDDPKDKQTNVIKWNLGDQYQSIAEQITGKKGTEARDSLLAWKGDGKETLYTTIRFVKRNIDIEDKDKKAAYEDMTAIYVTLNIPGPQVHFAYAEITKKDLSHWYKLNSYKAGSEADYSAIDILENVPTPAEQKQYFGYPLNLEYNQLSGNYRTNEFQRPLYENFLNGMVNISMGGRERYFNKYVYAENGKNKNISFDFTLPVKGVNAEFDSQVKMKDGKPEYSYWTVKGISGREYWLTIGQNQRGEANKGIYAHYYYYTAWGQQLESSWVLIAQITNGYDGDAEYVPYIRLQDNDYANDILNYAGRYDANGANMANESESNPFYLNNPDGDAANRQTFTTYLKINTIDECYNLLLKNPYFNAKFLRPINVWGGYYEWNDAFNDVQVLNPSDLLTAKDWRNYTISFDYDWRNGDNKRHEFKEGEIGWDFYNIYALRIDYNEIYTDHAAEKSVRDAIAAGFGSVSASTLFSNNKGKLSKASEIPSLKSQYLTVRGLNSRLVVEDKDHNVLGYKVPQTPLEYTNNGGNVQDFHLFVPITVQYAWGHTLSLENTGTPNTFKVWTVIKVHQTTGTGSAEAKKR